MAFASVGPQALAVSGAELEAVGELRGTEHPPFLSQALQEQLQSRAEECAQMRGGVGPEFAWPHTSSRSVFPAGSVQCCWHVRGGSGAHWLSAMPPEWMMLAH